MDSDVDQRRAREEFEADLGALSLKGEIRFPSVSEPDEMASILNRATPDDLIVMNAGDCRRAEPPLPSSLAEDLAQRTDLPMLLVRGDLRAGGAGSAS
jgi:hypothetical protein